MLLNKSRTYDLPINSSDVQRLKYKRLVGDGELGLVIRGYSEQIRALPNKSRTYHLPYSLVTIGHLHDDVI